LAPRSFYRVTVSTCIFSPKIIIFLQYSHIRSSHVPEIRLVQGLIFNILLQPCWWHIYLNLCTFTLQYDRKKKKITRKLITQLTSGQSEGKSEINSSMTECIKLITVTSLSIRKIKQGNLHVQSNLSMSSPVIMPLFLCPKCDLLIQVYLTIVNTIS
jgi:hypothetical protein